MTRGSTPTFIFNLKISPDDISKLRITFKQGCQNVLELKENDVTVKDNALQYTLSQEESLAFDDTSSVRFQMKVKCTDGKILVSRVKRFPVDELFNEEVL